MHSYEVFQKHEKVKYDKQRKVLNAPQDIRKLGIILFLQSSMMVDTKPDLLSMDI